MPVTPKNTAIPSVSRIATIPLQLAKVLSEHLLCKPGYQPLQLAKTSRSPLKIEQQRRFPFAADNGSRQLHWASLVIHFSQDPAFQPGNSIGNPGRLPKRAY